MRLPLFFVAGAPYTGCMTILSGWFQRLSILTADNKGPWGGGSGGGDSGGGGDDKSGGPRNPWAQPPKPRGNAPGPSALDEFLKRARGGGGGGLGGGGGRPRIPGAPSAGQLWAIAVGVIVVGWILLTSIHSIGPQERGVVTTLGRYSGTLSPGYSVTLPAPFADVAKVDVAAINTDTFPDTTGTDQSSETDKLMLTADQNIVDLDYSVRWQISNPQDFAFQIADPKETLRATAQSAMRAAVATATLDEAIGNGRGAIEAQVQQSMQEILDRYNSGIRIQGVAIRGAQAPAQVADAFKEVSAAQQEAQGNISKARGYAQQVLAKAQGEAAAFDVIYAQYKLAPEVTRRRMYYDTMEQVLSKSDKTIVEAPGVTSYLPLPGLAKRLPDAPASATPAPQVQGAGQ